MAKESKKEVVIDYLSAIIYIAEEKLDAYKASERKKFFCLLIGLLMVAIIAGTYIPVRTAAERSVEPEIIAVEYVVKNIETGKIAYITDSENEAMEDWSDEYRVIRRTLYEDGTAKDAEN